MQSMGKKRIYSIDTLRFLANFCIVVTHTKAIYYAPSFDMRGSLLLISYLVYSISRLALPFFFIFSGYFFTKSILKGTAAGVLSMRACKKLLFVFLCYQLFYGLIPADGAHFLKDVTTYGWIKAYYWHFWNLASHPVPLIFLGTKYHLWFLPALTIGLLVIGLFDNFTKKMNIPIFCIAYLFNILLNAYNVKNELHGSIFNILEGIAISIAYVSAGSLIARITWNSKIAWKLIIIGISLLLIQNCFTYANRVEIAAITLIGILPTSMGIFMLAMNNPKWGEKTPCSKFGLLTLWIYGIHPFILDQLKPLHVYVTPLIWNFLFPFSVYAISVVIVIGLKTLVARRNTALNVQSSLRAKLGV